MESLPLTPTELGKIAGPLLIGYLLTWGFFGVLSLQVYLYYLAFPDDRTSYKIVIYGAYLLEAAQTFLYTKNAFRTFASGIGNPAGLNEIGLLWLSAPIMSGLAAFVSQAAYAYRIAVVSEKRYIPGCILLLAGFSLAGSIAVGVKMKNAIYFTEFLNKDSLILVGIWQGGSAACDVLVATSMIYYLRRYDTEMKQTNVLLAKITRLVIETGSLTASIAILSLVLNLLPGPPTYYQTSVGVLGKCYSNSMMVVFNSRTKIRPGNTSISFYDFPGASTDTTTRRVVDIELGGRVVHGGVFISREEVSFPPLNEDQKENITNI